MASPARSIFRLATVVALAAGLALQPAVAAAQQGMSLIRDTEIEEILHDDAAPIFRVAGFNPKDVEILLIGSKDMNAFAGPGVMAVFTGLILETKNPNELQGVMGHEIGHLAGGHSARSGEMQKAGMVPMILIMGLAVLAAMAGAGAAAGGLLVRARVCGSIGAGGYSRTQDSRPAQARAPLRDKAGPAGPIR